MTQADYIFEARQVDMTGLTDGTPLANALEESELPTVVIMNANKLGHLSMLAEMTWCIEEDADPQKPGSAFDQTVLSVVYLPRTDRHYREVMRVLNVKQPKDELTVTSLQELLRRDQHPSYDRKCRRHNGISGLSPAVVTDAEPMITWFARLSKNILVSYEQLRFHYAQDTWKHGIVEYFFMGECIELCFKRCAVFLWGTWLIRYVRFIL